MLHNPGKDGAPTTGMVLAKQPRKLEPIAVSPRRKTSAWVLRRHKDGASGWQWHTWANKGRPPCDANPRITLLVCGEDALGQHDVNANVSVHELGDAYVTCHAGQHVSVVVA